MNNDNSQKAGQYHAITRYMCGKCRQIFNTEEERDQHKLDKHSKEARKQ